MAYYKPQSPIKNGEDHIYPLTTYDQIIMPDGTRWNGETSSGSGEDVTLEQLGITATAEELNYMDGVISNVQTQLDNNLESAKTYTDAEITEWIGDTTVSAQINTAIGQVSQQISQKAETFTTTAVFPHGSWVASTSGFPYEQTVTCSGVLTTDTPFVDVDLSAYTTYLEKRIENWAAVARVTVLQDNTITAYLSEELPNSVNTPMIVKVVR